MKNPYATTAALLCTLCLLAATACRQAGGTQESGNTVQDLSALTGQGEVLLSGGNILTMTDNPDGSPVTAEALLIRDGKIAAVTLRPGDAHESLKAGALETLRRVKEDFRAPAGTDVSLPAAFILPVVYELN